jgi:hypothetical protein
MAGVTAIAAMAFACLFSTDVLAREAAVITRDQLQEMFDSMSDRWDVSEPLLWGYFFTHSSRVPLEKAAKLLEASGYRFVEIHLGDKESATEPDEWWLHVEKVEVHSVDSLDRRNQEFYRLAESLGLDSYDGMDVGPAPRLQ